jgi:hypothetical protein
MLLEAHYGLIFIASGHLGLLRPASDSLGDCTGDPLYQEYVEVPNWDSIRSGAEFCWISAGNPDMYNCGSRGPVTAGQHRPPARRSPRPLYVFV